MKFRIQKVSDFEIKPCKDAYVAEEEQESRTDRIRDETGRIIIQTARTFVPYWEIEINTLEELMQLQKEVDHDLIISENNIVIYDGYIE